MARALMLSDLVEPKPPIAGERFAAADLAGIEPIKHALAILDRAAAEDLELVYPVFWLNRLYASGGSASVNWMRNGADDFREALLVGTPCDSLMHERSVRIDALRDHLKADPARREAVVAHLNAQGRFLDNRPYASPTEAVDEALAAGLRLMINREGELEYAGRFEGIVETGQGWPLQRASQRFTASCNQRGWQAEIINIIRDRGTVHEGSGWVVLERVFA